VKGDCRIRAGSDPVAFVLCEGRAVFDYEDPSVAIRFLATSSDCLQGRELWSALPAEVAAATLCSAGLRAACAALRTCKGWSEDAISLGCRERAYKEMTGWCHSAGVPTKKEMIRERISGVNFNHDIASVLRPEGQHKVHSSLYNCGENIKALRDLCNVNSGESRQP
ncbi:unnamed protein product, partial [Symbiodinium necroappetens]